MRIDELAEFGVADVIILKLIEVGFEVLTEAQEEAVRNGLFNRESLLIDAPTNTGKTFIGELAVLNTSKFKEYKRSFFLVPLKALAEEIFSVFMERYGEWGLDIAISTADRYENDERLMEFDVIISTYEKLNNLLIKKPEILNDVGLVVIDEIQNISDPSRGITLEILITKLKIARNNPQIIGLSATVSNADQLSKWLKANLIQIKKRDVELKEGLLYVGNQDIQFRGKFLKKGDFIYKEFNSGNIDVERELNLNYVNKIVEISQTEQCLIFRSTIKKVEEINRDIMSHFPEIPEMEEIIDEIDSIVESTPSTRRLKESIKHSVAFHHAGLLMDERRIIENAFRQGLIRVISATTTLGAGINTPAKNVIILFHKFWSGENISVRTYKNISGRAGRLRNSEEFGRSMLLADSEKDLEFLWDNYINARPEVVISQIPKKIRFSCAVLGLISSNVCSSRDELRFFMRMTFFGHLLSEDDLTNREYVLTELIDSEVNRLIDNGFLNEEKGLIITELGRRCAEEQLSPETILLLYNSIRRNEDAIKSTNDYDSFITSIIHICCCTQDSYLLYAPRSRTEIEELEAIWTINKDSYFYSPRDRELFLRSLRTTRMLQRWIEGMPYFNVASYAPAGVIKRIAENIQWILRGLARLIQKPLFDFDIKFSDYLYNLSERIYFGVEEDALEIIRLRTKGIHRRRAMHLARAGYNNIDSILEASIEDLTEVDEIGSVLASRLKERVEIFIEDEIKKNRSSQIRKAINLGENSEIISDLYDLSGDIYTRHIVWIFNEIFKIRATFIGEAGQHEPDILIEIEEGNIIFECKRKESGKVSAKESEEILGKSAKYKPIAQGTIGHPEFNRVAQRNAINANLTLIPTSLLGEVLIKFWNKEINHNDIINLLRIGRYIKIYDEFKRELV